MTEHERWHQGIIFANLGHNPGCDVPDCRWATGDVRRCPTPDKKIRVSSRGYAEWLAATLNQRRGRCVEAYLCSCGLWHMRNLTKRKAAANARHRANRLAREAAEAARDAEAS